MPATRDAAYVGDLTIEPGHALLDVNEQLFASVVEPDPPVATNSGFVWNYARQQGNTLAGARRVMHAFDPARLPVLSTLAREFVLCDRWFASVPGPTWPNRFFTHAGTSGGFADNQFRDYQFQTIYHRLDREHHDWAIYFHDFPHAYTLASLRTPKFAPHFRFAKQFFLDLKHGRLPAYSFIEPRYFDFLRWKANDLHPPHDVRLGEHLVADIYEALRKSSAWDSSLFIVLFDEHGGLYDHVPPPAAINPDGKDSTSPPFRFQRLGPRVPAVVISPWVRQGVVDSTVFDHTSVIASVRELFGLGGPLTDRDGAAATITPPAAGDGAVRDSRRAGAAAGTDGRRLPRRRREGGHDRRARGRGPGHRCGVLGAADRVSAQPGGDSPLASGIPTAAGRNRQPCTARR